MDDSFQRSSVDKFCDVHRQAKKDWQWKSDDFAADIEKMGHDMIFQCQS